VRTGLVSLGVVIAVVGVGVLVAAISLSSPAGGSHTDVIDFVSLPSGSFTNQTVAGVDQPSANVVVNWTATGPVNVHLYQGVACAAPGGICANGTALAAWSGTSGGEWSTRGAVSFPWVLEIQNPSRSTSSLTGTLLESWPATSTLSFGWSLLVSLVGAIILMGIGGVAVFLGLFLRSGVYRPSAGAGEGDDPPDLYDPDFPDEPPDSLDDLDGPDEPEPRIRDD
jgi:hypothetical protein